MIYRNLKGTTLRVFSMALKELMVYIGTIDKDGILQGQDQDQRTTRDLVQYNPRWKIPVDYTQLATEYEVHDLTGALCLDMEAGACYELDAGAIVTT
ncbi:MAG: hypothetical protein U9Q91_00205 [Candidatus Marinimicrobia bacterium]|nr:hypothetical protein [Candidatus Neomarinimicrobiota bacterium]